jgi:hypothetical protein
MDATILDDSQTRVQIHLPYLKPSEKQAAEDFIDYIRFLNEPSNLPQIRGFTLTPTGVSKFTGVWWDNLAKEWVTDWITILVIDLECPYEDRTVLLPILKSFRDKALLIYDYYEARQDVIYITARPIGIFAYGASREWLICLKDISRCDVLVALLSETTNAISAYLLQRFSLQMRQLLLGSPNAGVSSRLLTALVVDELNSIIATDKLWEQSCFREIQVSPRTRHLLSTGESLDNRLQINRYLLEDALPIHIKPI